jgi:hypothetical protein
MNADGRDRREQAPGAGAEPPSRPAASPSSNGDAGPADGRLGERVVITVDEGDGRDRGSRVTLEERR